MEPLIALFKRPFVRRMLLLAAVVLVLYWLRGMLSVFLLTFMFAYLGNSAQKLISRVWLRVFHRRAHPRLVVAAIYALGAVGLGALLGVYVPVIARQLTDIVTRVSTYFETFSKTGAQATGTKSLSLATVAQFISSHVDLSKYLSSGGETIAKFVTDIGTTSVNIFLSLILSLFFLLGKPAVLDFCRSFQESKLHWLYDDLHDFAHKFSNSFGKVIQTQLVISCVNTAISVVALGFMGFRSLVGLGAMIFVLGLVPVAGVFISLIPLCIIGYAGGGLVRVAWVLVLVAVLHALEGYVLNPKLMSQQTQLPVFITFLVLLVSEHIIGVWGLIIGLPLAVFLLDLFEVMPAGRPRRVIRLPRRRAKEGESGG